MKPPQILIVEKTENANGSLIELLDKVGFHVSCSNGAPAGLERFHAASFDLVITDAASAQVNGVTFLEAMRKTNSATPIVAVLAEGELYNVAELVRAGANDVIARPFEPRQVLRSVSNVLRQFGTEVEVDFSQVDPNQSKSVFGQKFRELRKLTGISVKELAQIFQCSPSYIYNIERGIRDPQTPFIIKACEVFGVSCDYILRNRLQKDVIDRPDEIELVSRYRKLPTGLRKAFLSQFRYQFRIYEKLVGANSRV